MDIDWTQIILSIIALLGTVLTGVLVPYLLSVTTEKQRANIDYWVKVAVIYIEKNYPNIGHLKKEDVTKIIEDMGLKITKPQLDMLIDAVVEILINKPYDDFIKGRAEIVVEDYNVLSQEL